jgi:hypothetical protein
MSDRQRPRNLTSSFTATGPRRWKVVGGDRVGTCTFCAGGPIEAVVGCPDDGAPVLWQVAVYGPCLADTVMTRFAAVQHQRRRCHANQLWAARRLKVPTQVQAAAAARHVRNALSRRTRSVRRDVRWRWMLKVFWTTA